jgi:hypothetical protein
MRALFTFAAAAALTITLGSPPGDPAPLPPQALHNPDSTYRPELIFTGAAEMQNVLKGIF